MRIGRIGLGRDSRKIPAEVVESLGIGKERVLAWSPLAGGGAAAATAGGLHVMTPRGELITRPWSEVDRAAWDGPSATLGVWWIGTRASTALEVLDDSRLPVVVRERVQSSVVLTALVPVDGGEVRIALRRDPDGSMRDQAVAPAGINLKDPQVAALVAAAMADLRDDAGVGPGDVVSNHPSAFGSL